MLKKYGFLFGSLAVLVVGLICLLASGMGYTTLVLLLIGILCTVASMFASLPTQDYEQNDTDTKEGQLKEGPPTKEVESEAKPTLLPEKKHKIVCKYCKNRFPCTADNCPHCGAPVDVASLSPECLEVVPHEKEMLNETPKTTSTSKKKTNKNK